MGALQVYAKKMCNHGFNDLTQIHIFCNGFQSQPKLLLDATTDGSLMSKSTEEVILIIDQMTLNGHQVQYNRGSSQRKPVILDLGTNDAILVQNKSLTQIVEELTKQLSKLP